MPADTYDLVIQQGAPFERTFTFTNASTEAVRTGLTLAEGTVRPSAESSVVLLNLTTYLTVDGTAATATLEVTQAVVDALTFVKPAVWDLFCTFDGAREKMCQGSVRLIPNVTP
jgi:hypothetical protein